MRKTETIKAPDKTLFIVTKLNLGQGSEQLQLQQC
jgi:hypothetical protein